MVASLSESLFWLQMPRKDDWKDTKIRSWSDLLLSIFLTLSFAMLFFIKILIGMMFLSLSIRVGRVDLQLENGKGFEDCICLETLLVYLSLFLD